MTGPWGSSAARMQAFAAALEGALPAPEVLNALAAGSGTRAMPVSDNFTTVAASSSTPPQRLWASPLQHQRPRLQRPALAIRPSFIALPSCPCPPQPVPSRIRFSRSFRRACPHVALLTSPPTLRLINSMAVPFCSAPWLLLILAFIGAVTAQDNLTTPLSFFQSVSQPCRPAPLASSSWIVARGLWLMANAMFPEARSSAAGSQHQPFSPKCPPAWVGVHLPVPRGASRSLHF